MQDERPRSDERDQILAALREREQQLQGAMREGRVIPWEWQVDSDIVRRALDSALFGTVPENLASFLDLVHEEDRPAVRAALQATLERGAPYAVTYRVRVLDGHRWLESRGSLLRDDEGQPRKLVGVVVEVTERKELEQRLAQAQKMEAIGLLAGGIAHDLNNILTTVYCNAHLLAEDARSDPKLVGEIVQASRQAASLTSQLLAFSRHQPLVKEPVDLSSVVKGVLALTLRTLGEHIEVEADNNVGAGPSYVLGDSGQLGQVLLNLLINARDAMPSGGKLRVVLGGETVDPVRADILSVEAGEYALLQVSDTGLGMDAATQARMFEPFFTTKGPGRGTGLGLATVYGIVKQSGGAVTVESAPGQGTRFDVYLPRTDERPRPAAPRSGTARRAEPSAVLLVEDDDAVRRIAGTVLTRAGYRVTEAAGGAVAAATFQLLERPPDLLVTDVVMPGVGGVALVQKLRERRPDLKVLFMSGYADDAYSGLADGAALLRKPFSPEELLAAVAKALDRSP